MLVWDPDLARNAQLWATRGKYQLAPEKNLLVRGYVVGQNVGMSRGSDPSQVVGSWYAEVARSTDGGTVSNSNTRGLRAYAQVTWKATKRVGCGVGPNNIVVCHYGPAGNIANQYTANTGRRIRSQTTCTSYVNSLKRPPITRMVAKYCGKLYRKP